MNNNIAGIPFFKAGFDEKGTPKGSGPALPAGTTDVYVISHGWNNSDTEATELYTELFTNFKAVAAATLLRSTKIAIVGVYWPSKKFDEMVAVESAANSAGGSGAGLASGAVNDPAGGKRVGTKIKGMKKFFKKPTQQQTPEENRALLPK